MKKTIKKVIVKLDLINILSIFFIILKIFPIKKNKIVFVNFSGKGFGDNPKYIAEMLVKSNKDLDMVWLVNNLEDTTIPNYIRKVKFLSVKSFFELVTAKVWVNNSRFDQFVLKRKGQFYIQTWHGGLALKKIEYDAEDKLSDYYKKVMKKDNNQIDLMISNSGFCTKMYKNGFRYNGKILECGSPRNDILINYENNIVQKVKEIYNLKNNKILLYAPTFRKNYDKNPYDIDFKKLEEILNNYTASHWKILVKLHPRIANGSKNLINTNNIINVSNHNDIQELIIACDCLITDYSSTMFEAMLANKPVIIYANDISNYSVERGTYFEFEDLPFPIAQNNSELFEIIQKNKIENIQTKYSRFKDNIQLKENGIASEEVGKIILNILDN